MDLSKMTNEEARAIVAQAQNVFDASIADQQRSSPKEIQSLPLDLTVARNRSNAMKVSFPFKSVLVEQATDLQTYVYMIPISNDSGNDAIRLGLKDVYKNEFGFRECYIYWDAQPAKSILLKFFVRSIIENGRLVLDQNSVVNNLSIGESILQNDGLSFTLYTSFYNLPSEYGLSFMTPLCYNDLNVMNGNVNIPYPVSVFQVPKGYSAEMIGCDLAVFTAIGSYDWGITFHEVDRNQTFANVVALRDSGTTICSIASFDLAAQTYTKEIIRAGGYGVGIPKAGNKKRVFAEGKCIIALLYNEGGASTGVARLLFSIRLTRNVE